MWWCLSWWWWRKWPCMNHRYTLFFTKWSVLLGHTSGDALDINYQRYQIGTSRKEPSYSSWPQEVTRRDTPGNHFAQNDPYQNATPRVGSKWWCGKLQALNFHQNDVFRQNAGLDFNENDHFGVTFGSKIETKFGILGQINNPKYLIWAHALCETGSKGHGFASIHESRLETKHPIILYYYLWGAKNCHMGPKLTPRIQILPTFLTESGQEIDRFWSKSGQFPDQKLSEKYRHIRFLATSDLAKVDFLRNLSFFLTKIWIQMDTLLSRIWVQNWMGCYHFLAKIWDR